jgi:hypothetical protein
MPGGKQIAGIFSIMWGNLLKLPSSGAFITQDIEMIRLLNFCVVFTCTSLSDW